jgi:O-acetylhomoserine (thiol)-lyase
VAIGGVLVDGGRFDWEQAASLFPTMTEPYQGYHGIDFAEEFGPQAFITRARVEGMRDFGACMSPANAFQILQGVETLPLRMERHVANTRAVAAALKSHPAVAWISYPGLPEHPDYRLAKRLFPKGPGSIIAFGIKGGREAGRRFIESLELASHLANVGDAKTLVIHPASTTHSQMNVEELKAAGVGEDLVRLSIGLEAADDIIQDLSQALRASQKA